VLLTVFVVIVLAAWFGFNAFCDRWIANNGKDAQLPPATSPFTGSSTVTYTGTLAAWYAPPKSGMPTVIIVHGYGANRTDHQAVGIALQKLGYGVMAIDLGYETNAMHYGGGDREAHDVEDAVTYAKAHGSKTVVLLGYSAGGTESLLAAAADPQVSAVVADSSPVSFLDLGSAAASIPSWIFTPAPWMYGWFSSGGSLGSLSSIPSSYKTPTLVIQGGDDKTVAPSNGPAIVKITHGELWAVSGAGHTHTYELCPDAYVSQLNTFFNDAVTGHSFTVQQAC